MPLRIRLKPGEKIVVNGAVVSVAGERASTLVLHNTASVLRGKDILLPEDADTPVKRIYLAVQMLYMDPDGAAGYREEFAARLNDVLDVLTTREVIDQLEAVRGLVEAGSYYTAMSGLREVLKFEERLLGRGVGDG
ncbi:MAG: flagellar biosynthesis repressor FlbT [Alphaproteobacteria bacterium]|jgi:flagellar protein FlbT|nr:flagellar biosynthesis repressor FlbT [Alphaproteobacteria bacterium]